MIIPPIFTESYKLSGDGLIKSSPAMNEPSVNYAEARRFAVVKGVTYIFGGMPDGITVMLLKSSKTKTFF